MPGDDSPPKPAARPAPPPAPSTAPTFKSLEEVSRVVLRLEKSGVQLPDGIADRLREHLRVGAATTELSASVAWLTGLENLLGTLRDGLEGVAEELVAKQVEVDPATLKQALITDPQAAVRQELNQLKGTRFAQEKAEWRRRIDENLAALREKQERQVMRMTSVLETLPDGRARVKPEAAWWEAYVAWQRSTAEKLRGHFVRLMIDRWQRFVDREVSGVTAALETTFTFRVPEVDAASVRDYTDVLVASDARHYRDGGAPNPFAAPEELVDPRVAIQRAASRAGGKAAAAGRLLNVVVPVWGGMIAAGVGHLAGNAAAKKEEAAVMAELQEKAEESLRRKLVDDFRKRLERYKPEVERLQREYAADVQARLSERLQGFVDDEMRRRNEQVMPEQRRVIALRQREIRDRLEVIQQVGKLIGNTVLIDLELRRSALGDLLAKAANAGKNGEVP
jgi:hypothetical protein